MANGEQLGRRAVPIVVVDDHAAVRAGLAAMLGDQNDLEVVGLAATAREALELVKAERPAAVVVDYHLPDEDGLSLCLRLKTSLAEPPGVLVYSAFADELLATVAIVAGADEVVAKSAVVDNLLAAVRLVAVGSTRPQAIPPRAMETVGARIDTADLPILGMLAHRTPPGEVASTLGISPEWLTARRWAMLESMRGEPGRRRAGPRLATT